MRRSGRDPRWRKLSLKLSQIISATVALEVEAADLEKAVEDLVDEAVVAAAAAVVLGVEVAVEDNRRPIPAYEVGRPAPEVRFPV